MNIVAYGGGTNSTALLIECYKRNIPVDLILFADTGGERPETYEYVDMFSRWLVERGMPKIITVYRVNRLGERRALEADCLDGDMLPSIAYGYKSCSIKYKADPQNKYCNNHQFCREIWDKGDKVAKFIGYDADESHRAHISEDGKYLYRYPLVEWDMGRDECVDTICKAGLPQPGKSSCFFCPSMKSHEIRRLAITNPDLMKRALEMEANAQANLTSVKGLGRNWKWADLLATADMFEDEFLDIVDQACGCYDG